MTPVGAFGGSPGPYGTYDQGGDVFQLNEGFAIGNAARGMRGGCWDGPSDYSASIHRDACIPSQSGSMIGFRVASIPEPSSLVLLAVAALATSACIFRRRLVAGGERS